MTLDRDDINAIVDALTARLAPMLSVGNVSVPAVDNEPSGAQMHRFRRMAIDDLAMIRAKRESKRAAKASRG